MGDSFLTFLLSEIELCLNHRQGFLHVKDFNKENGNPGSLLTNVILQTSGSQNGGEPLSVIQKAEFRQWIEYISIYGHLLQNSSSSQPVLKELNDVLCAKSFFTSSSYPTIIDAVFYGILHKIMSSITFQEKEQYVNLSRWFNTIQHDSIVRRSRSMVTFSKNTLYT
ncbi:eukaryotic translation elongation factor 1 epsilon-1 isoform X2 [Homalodisca vitripennis]|uniref:eukaryotic translation elongation factor 1 epsilon-1 isoform X2 n=1 Tax=Homalodisca vitripennis TaxID=197043 RepID=UPI001EE9CA25|nr:eukaryotic translation elongation factor 1 epsilon-1 isoform X2 [Homalodisca vitripennis]